ncbi:MAG: molybdopterin-guanine dinucleotide biosynthesis protein A [Pseudomonadota bacterium]
MFQFQRWRVFLLSLSLFTASGAHADDRHAGYYYPEPKSSEIYASEVPRLSGTNRERRIGFVVTIANAMFERPYPPRVAVFAKGTEAEKLLIVALEDGVLDTLYRARAHLAALTSLARGTPIFKQVGPAKLNFFDLLKMLGFTQLTISDGDAFAHQVKVQ